MARAAILVVLAYLVGINSLRVDGPLGAGWLYLLIAPVLLSVLVGRQVGAYAAVFSFFIYAIMFFAHQQGLLPTEGQERLIRDLRQWYQIVNLVATFGMLLVTATLVQWMFNTTVSTAMREAEEKHAAAVGAQQTMRERADALATANERLQQRTIQLQTAAQVSQATARLLDPAELVEQVVNLIRQQFNLYYVGLFLVGETGVGADGGIVGEERAVLHADAGEVVHPVLIPGYSLQVGGTSAVGRCMANAQPHITLDVERSSHRTDEALLPETHSHIALPLRSRGRVIGGLDVQSALANAFSDEDVAALQTMADQIAIAIDNAQLFMALRERLEEIEAGQRRQTRGRWADLALREAIPIYERAQPDVPSFDDALSLGVDEAMLLQDTVVHSDKRGDSGQAALMTPIRLRDRVIGMLGLQEAGGKRWTSDEIALIEAVADQMALAIENARLIAETQRRAEREQALGQIGDLFNRSLDIETLLQTAVRELGQLLEVDEVAVQLQAPSIEEATAGESE
jgi:GAF domain-containing protein